MSQVLSNCCSAYPTSQDDIERSMCPKCFEWCEWLDEDQLIAEDKADADYEAMKEKRLYEG